jgi:hypothetical protein
MPGRLGTTGCAILKRVGLCLPFRNHHVIEFPAVFARDRRRAGAEAGVATARNFRGISTGGARHVDIVRPSKFSPKRAVLKRGEEGVQLRQ